MPSVYDLKPKFQQLLKPILVFLFKVGISANQITISAIIFSFIIGFLFVFAKTIPLLFWAIPIGLLIRMGLNALDGMMARTYNQQSKLGEVLNELGDVVSDLFIYFPLLIYFPNQIWQITIFLCLAIVNEFSGLLSKVIDGIRRYNGPMGKSDRAFVISIISILLFFNIDLSLFEVYIFGIINLLLLISTTKRITEALRS